jgi:hypothetical protein
MQISVASRPNSINVLPHPREPEILKKFELPKIAVLSSMMSNVQSGQPREIGGIFGVYPRSDRHAPRPKNSL